MIINMYIYNYKYIYIYIVYCIFCYFLDILQIPPQVAQVPNVSAQEIPEDGKYEIKLFDCKLQDLRQLCTAMICGDQLAWRWLCVACGYTYMFHLVNIHHFLF